MLLWESSFEIIMGKGESAGNRYFFLLYSPRHFLTCHRKQEIKLIENEPNRSIFLSATGDGKGASIGV